MKGFTMASVLLVLWVGGGNVHAATPPVRPWQDSWDGVHSFLVFAPYPKGKFDPAHVTAIAHRYAFAWSSPYVDALRAGNPALVAGTYVTSTQSDHDLDWINSNHPDWIVYKQDRVTPVTQFDYKALTYDITNPEVVDHEFEGMKSLANSPGNAVAWDNFCLDNSLGAVGVRDAQGNWTQKFDGKGSYADVFDPKWTDAMIEYARTMRDRLHTLQPYPVLMVPNADVKVISGDPVRSARFIDSVDGVLVEGGYFGPTWPGDPRQLWLRGLHFVEQMQAAGKAYFSIDYPRNGPVTRDFLQFTLASYLLVKGRSAYLLVPQPTKDGYDSLNPDACWYPEFEAPIGTPLGPMQQVAGDPGTENGVYLRRHSGGLSIVNASTNRSFTIPLPAGSYVDLYGYHVGHQVTMRPDSGLVLLRAERRVAQ